MARQELPFRSMPAFAIDSPSFWHGSKRQFLPCHRSSRRCGIASRCPQRITTKFFLQPVAFFLKLPRHDSERTFFRHSCRLTNRSMARTLAHPISKASSNHTRAGSDYTAARADYTGAGRKDHKLEGNGSKASRRSESLEKNAKATKVQAEWTSF